MDRSDSVDNACTVCHDTMHILAVGPCDHPVCYKCSTRMRVLCEQMDCPICRSAMPQVAFIHEKKLFKDINLRDCIPNRRNKIFYESEEIEDRYLDLLEFRCRQCPKRKPERTFAQLQTHMRREHQLFACDICMIHLKLFPYETKFYDRKYLAVHRRVGDEDDKSYKGHPLCEFCDTRYLDKDELMKHLRKDHYFCHFCDRECSNAYYNEYADLLVHFGDSHYLCTEDECGNPSTRFTNAFSSDIDLKSHKATVHNNRSKESRKIEVDFQFAPRHQGYGGRGGGVNADDYEDSGNHRQRNRGDRFGNRRKQHGDPQLQKALEASLQETESRPPVQERLPDPINDFPSLHGGAPAVPIQNTTEPQKSATSEQTQQPVDHFPSLPSSKGNARKSQNPTGGKNYAAITHFSAEPRPVVKEPEESRPVSLGSVKSATKERWASQAPKVTADDYPSLMGKNNARGGAAGGNSSLSWLQKSTVTESQPCAVVTPSVSVIKSKDPESVARPIRSVPVMRPISDEKEFPSLGGGGQKQDPVPNINWSKQKPSGGKRPTQTPRSEKMEDFQIPESFYVSNEKPQQSEGKGKHQVERPSSQNSKKIVVSKKEFPGLPKREAAVTKSAEKATSKVVKNDVKKEVSNLVLIETHRKKSKKSKKGSAGSSLNDIAAGLVNGNDSTNTTKPRKSNVVIVKSKSKVDENGNNSKPHTNKNHISTKPVVDWYEHNVMPDDTASASRKDSKKDSSLNFDNNFPSLHAMSLSVESTEAPPGFMPAAYPLSSRVTSAPPGFSKSAPLTKPTFSAHDYLQPADFTNRNQTLVQTIRFCLETVKDGFNSFKSLSFEFRNGTINASIYYTNIQLLIGVDDFKNVFPELLALLPDINKQQQLWFEHQVSVSRNHKQRGNTLNGMSPCSKCSQIVLKDDIQHHNLQHGDGQDFPSLGTASASNSKSTNGHGMKGSWIKAT